MSATPMEADVNSNVTLECHAYQTGNWSDVIAIANVSWTRNGMFIRVTEENTINVTSDTAGEVNFTCTVTTDSGNSATASATVEFLEEIFFEEYLENLTVAMSATPMEADVNSTVTLECHAYQTGNWSDVIAIANVSWTRNGMFMRVTEENTINVTSDTAGEVNFTCTVTTDSGNSATASVIVEFLEEMILDEYLEDLTVAMSATPMEADVNSTVTLECHAYQTGNWSDVIAIANVSWTRDGMFMLVTEENTLIVTSNSPGEVNFTCTVTTDSGNSATASVIVEFLEEIIAQDFIEEAENLTAVLSATPPEAEVNSTVTLECQAYEYGNLSRIASIANVSWTQDGVSLGTTQDNKINVTFATAGDSYFTCAVTTDSGDSATANLTVGFYAANETDDQVQVLAANVTAMPTFAGVNSTVTLTCHVYGLGNVSLAVSVANFTWSRNGNPFRATQENVLNVTSGTPGFVDFTCTVTTHEGTMAASLTTVEFYAVNETDESPSAIYPETCGSGQGYNWARARCMDCDGTNEFNDGSRLVCSYCRYRTGTANACLASDGEKTSSIGRRDVCISAVLWSQTCNATGKSLTDINKALSKDARAYFLSAFPASTDLCANAACENIQVTVARRTHLCQALTSCNASISCAGYSYKSTVKAWLYDVREFVNTGVGGVYRRAEEVFLESLIDLHNFPASQSRSMTFAEGLALALPVTRVDTTSIPENENRQIVATYHTSLSWSSNYQSSTSSEFSSLNTIIQDQVNLVPVICRIQRRVLLFL
ncbi:cell wall/surface repeat protein [Plakobranchus ocellatus]|uniref:Cell wall/surface repeat protein n=1 Tax=Plakobranchus ocellatus TaxID=259542 RepID=A0AAV3Z9V4_9GAST|nr:cell wall/surface repeat protein [Plakobranchus ocellatus]